MDAKLTKTVRKIVANLSKLDAYSRMLLSRRLNAEWNIQCIVQLDKSHRNYYIHLPSPNLFFQNPKQDRLPRRIANIDPVLVENPPNSYTINTGGAAARQPTNDFLHR